MTAANLILALAMLALCFALFLGLYALHVSPGATSARATHVLYRNRPWQSIELYSRSRGLFEATIWRCGIESGDIVLAPHAAGLAYRVLQVQYSGRYSATALLRSITSDELLRSGVFRDPRFSSALAEAVAGPLVTGAG